LQGVFFRDILLFSSSTVEKVQVELLFFSVCFWVVFLLLHSGMKSILKFILNKQEFQLLKWQVVGWEKER